MLTSKYDEFTVSGAALRQAPEDALAAPRRPAWRDALEGLAIGVLIFFALVALLVLGGFVLTHWL
jgi:hypothetical protein